MSKQNKGKKFILQGILKVPFRAYFFFCNLQTEIFEKDCGLWHTLTCYLCSTGKRAAIRSWEDGSVGQVLATKYSSPDPTNKWYGDRRTPKARWPGDLIKMVSSRFERDPLSNAWGIEAVKERYSDIKLWPPHVPVRWMHVYTFLHNMVRKREISAICGST